MFEVLARKVGVWSYWRDVEQYFGWIVSYLFQSRLFWPAEFSNVVKVYHYLKCEQ